MKCKYCKYWKLEDELPGISEFMECRRIDENDPDWWKKWHFRGPDDSCEYGEKGGMTMDDLTSKSTVRDGMMKYGFIAPDMTVHEFVEDELPSIPAVPLDKLCEWLAEHYGSPCQLAEIDCYPQCEPDENGECYGMRTDDKRCWHDYLTKWMEGLDGSESVVQKT